MCFRKHPYYNSFSFDQDDSNAYKKGNEFSNFKTHHFPREKFLKSGDFLDFKPLK